MNFKTINLLVITMMLFYGLAKCQTVKIPPTYHVLSEVLGDLNQDGIEEKVIVYSTSDITNEGTTREVQILKYENDQWVIWKKSRQAVLKSKQGGIMGDPYDGIEIKNGTLIFSFLGGSSWKWSFQDKYRFQNGEFELVEHLSTYGKLCEYWSIINFNLSSGKLVFRKEFEDCDKDQEVYKTENETFYKKGIKITIQNRDWNAITIISPKYKHSIHF